MRITSLPSALERKFLPEEFKITVWSRLKPYYNELLKREINSTAELEDWIRDYNELGATTSEEFAWRYIRITQDSTDERAQERYQYAIQELAPRISSFEQLLNKKLVNTPLLKSLDPEKYFIYLREVNNSVELFREENIPLISEIQLLTKEYGKIFSEMTIEWEGEQVTLQEAGNVLEENERKKRKEVYYKIAQRKEEDAEVLDKLFSDICTKRHQIALNAGFDNFRDYSFRALGRFDYTADDCVDFHQSILSEILPLTEELHRYRKKQLGYTSLRPWDLEVNPNSKPPIRAFADVSDLFGKTVKCLSQLDPFFGECLHAMHRMNHLDLESRKGKRPGGYNMPLLHTGVPFVFMNATQSILDVRTLLHESGHAVHSFLTRHYSINTSKHVPSEVAELAAMSMEMLSMEHWNIFLEDKEECKRAKIWQLEGVLKLLPWIALIDKFQHWIYTHPGHSAKEREDAWQGIYEQFASKVVDRSELDDFFRHAWHKQLHIFEAPFYYIEYGMAQLGAIAIWKALKEQPLKTIERYKEALQLGYTKTIGEIYQTAGIEFNFSNTYVKSLGNFVKAELEELL
ncbi:MAG: M3 family oligoendopeptidase [Bacteroidetes bacterium]|nr:M3 family oligoendopeptidase [Bacteroidota bacterium]